MNVRTMQRTLTTHEKPDREARGSTGRPKGEGAHLSGKDLLAARRGGVPALRGPLATRGPTPRPGAFRRALGALGAAFRRPLGALRGR